MCRIADFIAAGVRGHGDFGVAGLAFAGIVMLWLTILAAIILFARIRSGAAWLLAPYLAWVTFAAVLNFELWRLNS